MKPAVYRLCQFTADTGYFSKILYACTRNTLQAAEMFEQCLPAFRAQPGYIFEWRSGSLSRALGPVTTDRETVGFIANLQNQVQRRGIGRKMKLGATVGEHEFFQPGLAALALTRI